MINYAPIKCQSCVFIFLSSLQNFKPGQSHNTFLPFDAAMAGKAQHFPRRGKQQSQNDTGDTG